MLSRQKLYRGLVATLLLLGGVHAVAQAKVRIVLVGDSTVTDKLGYGLGFCANLTPNVTCIDKAVGGTSSKSFREKGWWDKALAEKPDYVLIQFGANDIDTIGSPRPVNTTMTEFIANIKAYVTDVRKAGAIPVLVTPLARWLFDANGHQTSDLGPHAEAVRTIAKEMNVPLIDLHADSLQAVAPLGTKAHDMWGYLPGSGDHLPAPDRSHLNYAGSYEFGRIVAVDLAKAVPALAGDVVPLAAVAPAGGNVPAAAHKHQSS